MPMIRLTAAPLLLLLAACNGQPDDLPGGEDTHPYAGIAESDRLRFTGTEPFWGGEVRGTALRFSTVEEPEGRSISVTRFAGRGGASWSGELGGGPFTLLASEGECNDGMSDRTYPFSVTVQLGKQMLSGCGWTDARPFTGPEAP